LFFANALIIGNLFLSCCFGPNWWFCH